MPSTGRDPSGSRFGWWLAVPLLVGAVLRCWQYAADTSLWLDEVALAKGILGLDLRALLTGALPFDQTAPKAFLLVEKLDVLALGRSGYALRLLPFVGSLVSLAAFARLAKRTLEGTAPLVATVLFATAAPFIVFGASTKQYSTDVCVAVLLGLLGEALTAHALTARRAAGAAAAGATLVWFSQPAALILAGMGVALLVWPRGEGASAPRWRMRALVLAAWGLSALASVATALATITPSTREYLQRYWEAGFAPGSLARALETRWPWEPIRLLFGSGGLGYPLPALYAVLAGAGFVLLWRRDRRVGALLAAPVAVTLGAAVAQLYPFSDRLILFLVPSFMLAIAEVAEVLRHRAALLSRPLAAVVTAAIVLPAVCPVAATPPPYAVEDTKALLAHLRGRRQASDKVYVYYAAAPAVGFYADAYGLDRRDYAVGGCHRGDSRRYLRELDTFRGQPRVWVLIAHALPRYGERDDILSYLDAIGTRRDALVVESRAVGRRPPPAEAYLYDLADPQQGSKTNADTFPLEGRADADARFGCDEGPQTLAASDFRD